ncbi:MAG TPA: HD domain-containing protein [bacterium]|nr:HD domain-containing protein [bacterium]HOL67515.1 HD domain-containing protein [bacterium]HPP11495.1 HD domain-containing protein [bacterium]
MLDTGLIEKCFQAASIQRWNDHIRPVEFTELDKQAHKMVLAYVIGRFEETERNATINWLDLIEGGIFEFLHRVILTDIKPPVFHRMMREKGQELNQYVLQQLEKDLLSAGAGFSERFQKYFFDQQQAPFEKRILQAAHYLATNWEFRIIYNTSRFIYGIEKTKEEIENEIEDYYDLIGVQKISLGKKSFGFIDLCGQLRFQQRWAHSPRLPKTSVLGHMLTVAIMTYLCCLELKPCARRLYNNFFAALFHDLPEVLTRDIIRPVKKSVKGLDEIIKEYEQLQLEQRLMPLLPETWREEMRFFTRNEFENRLRVNGQVKILPEKEIAARWNQDRYSPLDGQLIKLCDDLAAFVEVTLSHAHGIHSRVMEESRRELLQRYRKVTAYGIDFGALFQKCDQSLSSA